MINDSNIRPNIPTGSHPIDTGRYLLATNEINRLREEVISWIENRSPGAIIYGRPRLGKTRALKYLEFDLPAYFGEKLPVFQMRCQKYRYPSEGVFFSDLLKDVGHNLYLTGKPDIKRDRLIKFLIEQGVVSGHHRIILFIDDAQRLMEIQYDWLMDIYNELDTYGISMTVILIGQEELIHQRDAFQQSKKTQIIGRFMIHDYKFKGIKSVEDIKSCLAGYDLECEYPVNSGWSFTRYFFPEAFNAGYRLDACAEDIYNAFIEARQEAKLNAAIEIPMQYLTLSIEYLLKTFGANGKNVEWPAFTHWKIAVEKSGYIKAEVYQEATKAAG